MGILYTVGVFLAVLGVMVLVHEWGHYVVARFFGVGIEKFSIGMGPRVAGFRRGETEFIISAIPIGGYVKMEGEVPDEIKPVDELTPEERDRAFTYKPAHQRILIAFAGPLLNVILAVILAPVIYLVGVDVPAYKLDKPVVRTVLPDSAAEKAGFERGDEILSVDGRVFDTWETLEAHLYLSPDTDLVVRIRRNGVERKLILHPETDPVDGIGLAGFWFLDSPIVGAVGPGTPAEEVGLRTGDRLLTIDEHPINVWSDISTVLNGGPDPGAERTFRVRRGDETIALVAAPRLEDDGKYRIGIGPFFETVRQRYTLSEAIPAGMAFLHKNVFWLGEFLSKLLSAEISTKAMGGPVAIAKYVGAAARIGMGELVRLCTLITLQLGILNLLPIPALDGGHILFGASEIVSRRRPNQRFMEITQTVGFSVLLLAIALITVQDILKEKTIIMDFFRSLG